MNVSHLLGMAALSLAPLSAWPAGAAEPAQPSLRALLAQIEALRTRVSELEKQALAARPPTPPAASTAGPIATAPAPAPTVPAPAAVPAGMPPRPAPAATQTAQAVASTQGLPLFDRKFSFEQGLTYTHYDKRSLVLRGFLALDSILLGQINLQQIKTDQLQYDMTGRWSLSERVSVDVNLPLVYRRSQYFSPGANGGSASILSDQHNGSSAPGDASAGLYYQLAKAAPTDLDWIASVRLKAPTGKHPFGIKLRETEGNDNLVVPTRQPTGNGIWGATLGLSVLKSYDPLVLFGNLGYNYNRQRDFSDLSSTQNTTSPGTVKLGNAWSLGAGFALALNDKTSVSFSYAQLLQQAAHLRGEGGQWTRQVGSDVNSATFNASLTHQLSPHWTMIGTLSAGLTPDAPNVSFGLRFPYAF